MFFILTLIRDDYYLHKPVNNENLSVTVYISFIFTCFPFFFTDGNYHLMPDNWHANLFDTANFKYPMLNAQSPAVLH